MVIGQHGSWNRSTLSGYKVILHSLRQRPPVRAAARYSPSGFLAPDESVSYGQPVGVAIARDGALLVADDVGNVVWRVTGPEAVCVGRSRPARSSRGRGASAASDPPPGQEHRQAAEKAGDAAIGDGPDRAEAVDQTGRRSIGAAGDGDLEGGEEQRTGALGLVLRGARRPGLEADRQRAEGEAPDGDGGRGDGRRRRPKASEHERGGAEEERAEG